MKEIEEYVKSQMGDIVNEDYDGFYKVETAYGRIDCEDLNEVIEKIALALRIDSTAQIDLIIEDGFCLDLRDEEEYLECDTYEEVQVELEKLFKDDIDKCIMITRGREYITIFEEDDSKVREFYKALGEGDIK